MAAAEEETKNQISRLGELLKREGYEVDDEFPEQTWVTVERFAYLVTWTESDPDFYKLEFPMGLYHKDKTRNEHLNAVNAANAGSKLAKAYLDTDSSLNIVVDVVALGPKEFNANFARYISAIQTLLKLFNDEIGGQN